MKQFLIIIFFSISFINLSLASKTERIDEKILSVSFLNDDIESVFAKLEKATGYNFSYSKEDLNPHLVISMEYKEQTVAKILKDIGRLAKLDFYQVNNTINAKKCSSVQPKIIIVINT